GGSAGAGPAAPAGARARAGRPGIAVRRRTLGGRLPGGQHGSTRASASPATAPAAGARRRGPRVSGGRPDDAPAGARRRVGSRSPAAGAPLAGPSHAAPTSPTR